MAKRLIPLVLLIAAVGYYTTRCRRPPPPHRHRHTTTWRWRLGGRLVSLSVKKAIRSPKDRPCGDRPGELAADSAYYQHSAEGVASRVGRASGAAFPGAAARDQIGRPGVGAAVVAGGRDRRPGTRETTPMARRNFRRRAWRRRSDSMRHAPPTKRRGRHGALAVRPCDHQPQLARAMPSRSPCPQ